MEVMQKRMEKEIVAAQMEISIYGTLNLTIVKKGVLK